MEPTSFHRRFTPPCRNQYQIPRLCSDEIRTLFRNTSFISIPNSFPHPMAFVSTPLLTFPSASTPRSTPRVLSSLSSTKISTVSPSIDTALARTIVSPRAWLHEKTKAPPTPLRVTRKPHGYWNDLSNLERELIAVNAILGRVGKRSVPKLVDMKALGRGDLVAAVAKHGGVKKVAKDLRWGTSGKTKRRADESMIQVRGKVLRRPRKYWEDVQRVQAEIGAFVDEYGIRGVMPTQKQFYQFGRADLAQAAGRHGGLRVIAEKMGLKCRRKAKKRRYWGDFGALRIALEKFSAKHCPGYMPTGDELTLKGHSALTNAIAMHGGYPEVAKRLGLKARNDYKQGAPKTWTEKRLKIEIFSFVMRWEPEYARQGWMPTERMLRKRGRNDLSYAVSRFGGFKKVAEMVGLTMRKRGVFNSHKETAQGEQ